MKLFILLVGLVLVLEGLPYAAAPEAMKEWLAKVSEMKPGQLRVFGVVAICSGLIICWVVQETSFFQ